MVEVLLVLVGLALIAYFARPKCPCCGCRSSRIQFFGGYRECLWCRAEWDPVPRSKPIRKHGYFCDAFDHGVRRLQR